MISLILGVIAFYIRTWCYIALFRPKQYNNQLLIPFCFLLEIEFFCYLFDCHHQLLYRKVVMIRRDLFKTPVVTLEVVPLYHLISAFKVLINQTIVFLASIIHNNWLHYSHRIIHIESKKKSLRKSSKEKSRELVKIWRGSGEERRANNNSRVWKRSEGRITWYPW